MQCDSGKLGHVSVAGPQFCVTYLHSMYHHEWQRRWEQASLSVSLMSNKARNIHDDDDDDDDS